MSIESKGAVRDGGPAFPRVGEGFGNPNYDAPGMSLRDYFAGQALAGELASWTGAQPDVKEIVGRAYYYADEMVAARTPTPSAVAPEEET